MAPQILKTDWHGLAAWKLTSAELSAVIVPGMGAKIVSLVNRQTGSEWLIGPSARRSVKPVPYGGLWPDQDMAGWDEMFPTIIACKYPGAGRFHGVELPDHGEAWTLPWRVNQASDDCLALELQGQALPYTLSRTADLPEPATLRLRYSLQNHDNEAMPYLWAAHPQFLCGPEGRVVFPEDVRQVINTIPESWGWGPPETRFDWPAAKGVDGKLVRLDWVGPPTLKRGRKLFALPDVRTGWAAVLRETTGEWVRFEWDPVDLPYLGLWVDEGSVNDQSVAAPEPMTGWYDDLALAAQKGFVRIVQPGDTHTWTLTVRLGIDGKPQP